MRKHVLIVLALGALVAVSAVGIATAAGGETPVTVKVGNLELTANGGFSPKALSKTKQTPIELKASGEVKEADGSHPPAIREVILEADKNGEVHLKGIPTCKSGQLQATDTNAALKACKSALIGEGEATAQVAFAEQKADRRQLEDPRVQRWRKGRQGDDVSSTPTSPSRSPARSSPR